MFNLDDYETVEERLVKFWKDHPTGRIETKLIDHTSGRFIVWSAIYRDSNDLHPVATGLAEETVAGRGVNATSALENCETSSIGRSLANAGYATKGKRASREEMSKVKSKLDVESLVQETKEKLKQSSGEYVPVPNPADPWSIVPTKQGQTLGEAIDVLTETGFVKPIQPPQKQCKHGDMRWKTGESKTGKPWGQYKCPNKVTGEITRCGEGMDVIWYNLVNGQWKEQGK